MRLKYGPSSEPLHISAKKLLLVRELCAFEEVVADHELCRGELRVEGVGYYLTECVEQLVLESQPPRNPVNLISYLEMVNNKLTILWES